MRKIYRETKTVDGVDIVVEAFAPYTRSESQEPPDMPGILCHTTSNVRFDYVTPPTKFWNMIEPTQGTNTKDSDIIREAIRLMDDLVKLVK